MPLLDAASGPRAGDPPPAVTFLAPLDPFVWDRDLLRELFDFDYVWEVYVPEAKRRWGYYVLPLLFGDRLVGRIEPRIDRSTGTLRMLGLWWEEGFDPRTAAASCTRCGRRWPRTCGSAVSGPSSGPPTWVPLAGSSGHGHVVEATAATA